MNDRPDPQEARAVPDPLSRSEEVRSGSGAAVGGPEPAGSDTGRRRRLRGRFGRGGRSSTVDSVVTQAIPLTSASDSPTDTATNSAREEDEDLLDPAWAPQRRTNRLSYVLAAGLVAALGFIGGVLVQKKNDAGLTGSAAASAGRTLRAGSGQGFGASPSGTMGSTGPGSTSQGSGGQGAGGQGTADSGSAGGSGTAAGTPVVVGKVVSVAAGTAVVENFAGTRVTVHIGVTTMVTAPGMTGLRVGAMVSVIGDKATDGSVNATSVVSRGTGSG
jgi:hypothetical protein